jgi:hypothetical protein
VVTGLVGSADYPVRAGLQPRFAGGWRDVVVSRFNTR